MAGVLELMLIELSEAKGTDYAIAWHKLKWYLRTKPEAQIIREIKMIEDTTLFGRLWSLGLTMPMQEAAMERWQELR